MNNGKNKILLNKTFISTSFLDQLHKKAELADIYKKELDARDSRTTAETDTNESWPASSQEKKPKLLESKDLF